MQQLSVLVIEGRHGRIGKVADEGEIKGKIVIPARGYRFVEKPGKTILVDVMETRERYLLVRPYSASPLSSDRAEILRACFRGGSHEMSQFLVSLNRNGEISAMDLACAIRQAGWKRITPGRGRALERTAPRSIDLSALPEEVATWVRRAGGMLKFGALRSGADRPAAKVAQGTEVLV